MSNSLAIAAVTTTLRNLISQGVAQELGDGIVTTQPPDKARYHHDKNQINLFLYHILPNASWRTMDLPNRVKPGEIGQPPLALNLYYIITFYGKDNDDILAHRLLGQAMHILNDYAVLNPADIKISLGESDLHNQVERVRITLQPMSLEDISKLWRTFQTQYRISAVYEVSVVIIESSRIVKTQKPVLTRDEDSLFAEASLTLPFPTLEAVQLPNLQNGIHLGEVFTLIGHHLDSDDDTVFVRLMHPCFSKPMQLKLQQQSSTEIVVSLPNEPSNLPAGFYTVAVRLCKDGKELSTNALSFSLAPKIQQITQSESILTLKINPQVWQQQEVALLLGDRYILLLTNLSSTDLATAKTDTIRFNIEKIHPDEYFVKLRVDQVDSLLVDRFVTPPIFDATQNITLP
jgi:hypothetical protein